MTSYSNTTRETLAGIVRLPTQPPFSTTKNLTGTRPPTQFDPSIDISKHPLVSEEDTDTASVPKVIFIPFGDQIGEQKFKKGTQTETLCEVEAISTRLMNLDASDISTSSNCHFVTTQSGKLRLDDKRIGESSSKCRSNLSLKDHRGLNPNASSFVPSLSSGHTNLTRGHFQHGSRDIHGKGKTENRADHLHSRSFRLRPPTLRLVSKRSPSISNFPRDLFLGPKVTILDQELKIFVIDLLSEHEVDWILDHVEKHTSQCFAEGRVSWRKLYTYTHLDLPCSDVPALRDISCKLLTLVPRILGRVFGIAKAARALKPRSWKEPHLLRLQKLDGAPDHTGMAMHFDGSQVSWQLMLSTQGKDYMGGGTYFSSLRKTIQLKKGQVLVHPGDLYHRGVDITTGVRMLMVCFMDGLDMNVKERGNPFEDSSAFEGDVIYV